MFSDNAQASQSPIQRCLYLHAHSELFPAVPRSWSRQVLCKQFSQLYSFARCFSTKTWLIKPDNVTKSSKMGPHVIQNSEKRNCWLNPRRRSQWTQRRLGKRRWQVPAHVRVKFSGSPNWAWVNSNLLKSRFWSARRHPWELLNSRRLLQTNKPGDPHFLFFQFFLLIAKPCIRPAPLKFELTNQRWVGGRNCTVLTSSPKPRSARAGRSALASQNSSFRRAACSLSLIIYNKGNGEIFVKSKEELNWSRHLWCWLIVRGVGRSFSSSPFGKFLEKEKRLDACWQTPRTAATLFSVSGLSAVRRKYFLNLRRLNRWRI